MKNGLYSQYDYLAPAYIRLLKVTRGAGMFADSNPRDYLLTKVGPAYREAEIAYYDRLKKGQDGTRGSLEPPYAKLMRLEELIVEEVEFNTNPKTFVSWKQNWDSVPNY